MRDPLCDDRRWGRREDSSQHAWFLDLSVCFPSAQSRCEGSSPFLTCQLRRASMRALTHFSIPSENTTRWFGMCNGYKALLDHESEIRELDGLESSLLMPVECLNKHTQKRTKQKHPPHSEHSPKSSSSGHSGRGCGMCDRAHLHKWRSG